MVNARKLFAVLFLLCMAALASAAAPAVTVTQPNGGEQIRGTYAIGFAVSDADDDALLADIYYSVVAGGNENLVAANLDLETGICADPDNDNATPNNCGYAWNTAAATDGVYYMDVVVRDAAEQGADSSDGSFTVDNAAPVLSNASPANGAYATNANQQISIGLADNVSGIVESTIAMNVEGINYTTADSELSYSGSATAGTATFAPSAAFSEGHLVNVSLAVQDAAGNSASAMWSFTVDLVAPAASNAQPADSAYVNSAGQQISIDLSEATSGIDFAKLVMNVAGAPYALADAELVYFGNAYSGTLSFTPSTPFTDGQAVGAIVECADNAGNVMPTASWGFNVDLVDPILGGFTPEDGAYTNDASQQIAVGFSDPGTSPSGIDPDSILFRSINLRSTYAEGETITGLIGANAYAGQELRAVLRDVVLVGPPVGFEAKFDVLDEANAIVANVQVPAGANLVNYVFDGSGLPALASGVTIEAVYINQETGQGDVNVNAAIVEYDINSSELSYSGGSDSGTIIFTPAHELRGDIVQNISANFYAYDLAGNAATAASWQFTLEQEAPVLSGEIPADGIYVADENQQISVSVSEGVSGIDLGGISMAVNGTAYTLYSTALAYTGDAYSGQLTFTPQSPFPEGAVSVSAGLADLAGNTAASAWGFTIDLTPPVVSGQSPGHQAYTNDANTDINFFVGDALSGVDFAAMRLSVEDVNYTVASPEVTYNETTGFVSFNPPAAFVDTQVVDVVVTIDDNVSNSAVYDWNFTIDSLAADTIIDLTARVNKYMHVELDWSEPGYALSPVDYYNIYRSTQNIYDFNKGTPMVSGVDRNEYTDETVEHGKTYYYRVTSVDTAGNESELSNQVRITVYANVMMDFDYSEVALEPGETIAVKITVKNYLEDRQCVKLTPWVREYAQLEAEILANEFCLSTGESTELSMGITTFADSAPGRYLVEVEMEYDGEVKERYVGVRILGDEEIDLIVPAESATICLGEYEYVVQGLKVINRTAMEQEVTLTAESELFLPAFDPVVVRLAAGEEREVPLKLHTNYTTQADDYVIPVFARTESYYVERAVGVVLQTCVPADAALSIGVPDTCTYVDKNGSVNITISVTNLFGEPQTVRLSAVSDLIADVNAREMVIGANAERTTYVTVKGRTTDEYGEHRVKVHAWSGAAEVEAELCVIVGTTQGIELRVSDYNGVARACSAQELEVIEVVVVNTGDHTETVYLSIENPYSTISVDISEEEVELDEGESSAVYVAIIPAYDAPIGNKTIYINASTRRRTVSEQSIKIALDEFSEEIDEGTIRLNVDGRVYSTGSSRLDYDSPSGEITFTPIYTYDEGDALDMRLSFEDGEDNGYVLEFDYNVAEDSIRNLSIAIEIDDDYTDRSIDAGSIRFIFGGAVFGTPDSELTFYAAENRIVFMQGKDYGNPLARDIELDFEDYDGNDYEMRLGMALDIDIGAALEARAPINFKVVEPSLGLEEGVMEIVNFPASITLKQGASGLVAVTIVNQGGKTIENVSIKLWGLNARVYFPTVHISSIAPGQSVERTSTIMVAKNAKADTIVLTLEAKSEEFVATEEVLLTIEKAEAEPAEEPPEADGGALAGLVGLAAGMPGGAVGLGIILLILLVIIGMLLAAGGKKTEPWIGYHTRTGFEHR